MKKKKSLEKRTLSSTIAGSISLSLTLLQSVLLVPFFLSYWGTEKYGVWLGMLAFFGMMQALDLGHQNYVGNEFNKFYHTDKLKARQILGSGFRYAYLLGLLEFILLLLLIFFNYVPSLVGITGTAGNYAVELSLVILIFAWVLTGSFGGILVRIILPIGLYSRSIYLSLTIKIAQIAVLFFASVFNFSIVLTAFLYSGISLVYSIFLFFYIKNLMPEFFPWWNEGSWRLGFNNLTRSFVLTVSGIFDMFRSSGIVLVISSFLSASFIPVFTTVRTIPNTAVQLTALIINPLYPEMIRYHSKKEGDKLLQIFFANWLITGFIVNLFFMLLLPFIKFFYEWWTRGKIEFNEPLFLLLAFGVSISNFGEAFNTYIRSINRVKAVSIISVTRFVIFISVSLLLVHSLNLTGIGIAFVLSELICAVILPLFYTNKELSAFGSKINLSDIFIGIMPLLILSVGFLNFYLAGINNIIGLIVGIILLGLFCLLQWHRLSDDVKHRLKKVFLSKSYAEKIEEENFIP